MTDSFRQYAFADMLILTKLLYLRNEWLLCSCVHDWGYIIMCRTICSWFSNFCVSRTPNQYIFGSRPPSVKCFTNVTKLKYLLKIADLQACTGVDIKVSEALACRVSTGHVLPAQRSCPLAPKVNCPLNYCSI